MTTKKQQTANLLGATVLALYDELRLAVESYTGRTGESPSAVVILGHQPGISNDQLSKLVNITHTGTVRLVDRLVEDGLVERRSSRLDKRSKALYLTASGEAAREEILKAREVKMSSALNQLTSEECNSLNSILGKLLVEVSRDDTHKLSICRLCDANSCPNCPILVSV